MTTPRTLVRLGLATALLASAATVAPVGATAATIAPTQSFFADEFDPGNGVCSLREAIAVANTNSTATEPACEGAGALGDDEIRLEDGTYVLDLPAGADPPNDNEHGDLDVTTSAGQTLTITGGGAGATAIDTAAWDDRVLHHPTGTGRLTVRDLTVAGGNSSGSLGGGGILVEAFGSLVVERALVTGNAAEGIGGGIHVSPGSPLLTIRDSVVSFNSTEAGGAGGVRTDVDGETLIESSVISGNDVVNASPLGGGGLAAGSAVINTLSITDSVIAGNTVIDSDGSGTALGGGIKLFANAPATIRGSTISGNEVLGGGNGAGAGIDLAFGGELDLVNSTVSGNEALGSATSFGGGLRLGSNTAAATIVHSTIGPNPIGGTLASAIANPSNGTVELRASVVLPAAGTPACVGANTSFGHNVGDAGCGLTGTNDLAGVDSGLGALAGNDGPTAGAPGFLEIVETQVPEGDSPIVDHVPAAACQDHPDSGALVVDQRRLPRPDDGDGDGDFDCEAGSVELQVSGPFVPPPPPPPPAQQGQTSVVDNSAACGELRERLRKAKRGLKKAKRADKPTKKKRRKVRKLRRKRDELGCER